MAQLLNVCPSDAALRRRSPESAPPPARLSRPPPLSGIGSGSLAGNPSLQWSALQEELRCKGRHSCFFSDGRKQDQARKALESALGGKKEDFEKWNKEIEKREEIGRGSGSGRGGWFGGGGWFGWFGEERFWEESQQAALTIVAIILFFLLITKGNVLLALVFNPLLFTLRSVRSSFTFMSSWLSGKTSPGSTVDQNASKAYQPPLSAKERVVRKWGMD